MFERRPSVKSQHNMDARANPIITPNKIYPGTPEGDYSPTISRYGRSHKPKMQDDYISTDKKVSAYLKLSPGNQIQYFNLSKEPKKKQSPKKTSPEGGIKRGRPPKPKTPVKEELGGVESLITSIIAEPQDPSLPVDGCEWMVGDLAWGRVGGHPFWPCIIALDPLQKIFTKIVYRGRNNVVGQRWIHVQFFGDNGRRSWLNSSAVMTFNGRDSFMQLAETVVAGMRKKDPKQTSAFVIKPAVVQVWEKAVQEAEDMANTTREERIAFFALHFPLVIPKTITREELIEKVLDDSQAETSPPKKRGRKRKAETSPQEDQVRNKQIKLEEVEIKLEHIEVPKPDVTVKQEVSIKQEPKEECQSLLSSTPRTIADRKKRQALLIQMARSNQMAAADAAAGDISAACTPVAPVDVQKPTPSKRPSCEETTPIEKKKTKRKYVKKTVDADFQNFCSRNFERVSDENPDLNKKEVNKHLQKLWNHTDESSKSRPSYAESTPIEKKKPKKKYVKKTVDADFQNFCSRNFEKVSDENPELNEKEINKHLQKLWNGMEDLSKSRYKVRKGCAAQEQEDSESLEETWGELEEDAEVDVQSSKSSNETEVQSSKSGSPPPSVSIMQKPAAVKRSCKNLFSGVKNEKVCQICERAGDTVRCRGPCQGFYHPVCVTNPPSLTPVSTPTSARKGKKGRSKKSLGSSPQVENETPLSSPLSSDKEQELPIEAAVESKSLDKESKSEDVVEVVETEGKSSTKVRKGSKDSKDSLSGEEDEGFRCKDCSQGRTQPCFACHEYVQKKTGEEKLYRCITANCGKVYHEECLKAWPQTSWRGTNRAVLTCPQHTCHTCVSDNPAVIKARYSNDKLVRCVRCPASYHHGNFCLPAGSEILSSSQIICPQHYKPPRKGMTYHVNAAWCFICASGGSLICCDLCPTAFHADCLKISTPPDTYVCEDCQTGRFPLYSEIVWVKLGAYRWWPAEILYPFQIPDNIFNLPHVRGEFAVRFFGSHDHYWVNRGRVFLYQDGDTAGKSNYKKSSVDQMFEKAVKEASEAQRKYLEGKASRDAETRPGMKPPNYVKLKANKPVGNVRTMEMNLSNLTPCECDPKADNPCAPDSDCLNRILMVECNPQVCPAGEKCCNQLFEKRLYPPLQPYQTQERGWGLKTLVPLKKGDFVIEYVGEMIDEEEYKRRLGDMHERNEDNFYFLTIDKDRMLDAGPKGNVARFMNHSCQPNCETQKWTVNGDTRVGLFALFDIPADTELVFNYNLESTGNDKKPCMCGAPNCSGFIGVKAIKQEKEDNKEKKPVKKKKTVTKTRDRKCFMCWKAGDLLRCDGKHCTKGYHLSCLGKKQAPQGYWLCPWHQCNICNKGRVRRCTLCVNSFCQEHSEGNIHEDPDSKHLLCTKHNQNKAVSDKDLQDTKDSSLLMEVDGNSSDNSTVASSLSSDVPTSEATNNNVFKAAETPRLRTRRSKSTGAGDIVLNGSFEKVNSRRKRPSSVDEALIVSNEKTEFKNKKSCKPKGIISTTDSIARGIIDEVIDNLPEKREGVSVKREKYEETKKEICNNISLVEDVDKTENKSFEKPQDDTLQQMKPEVERMRCSGVEKTSNTVNERDEASEKETVNNAVEETNNTSTERDEASEKETANSAVEEKNNTAVERNEASEKDTANSEVEEKNNTTVERDEASEKDTVNSAVEKEKNTTVERDDARETDTVNIEPKNVETVQVAKSDVLSQSVEDIQVNNENVVEDVEPKTKVESRIADKCDKTEKMEAEDKNNIENDCTESESPSHNGKSFSTVNCPENNDNPTSILESNVKENCVQNGLVITESSIIKCTEEPINKEPLEDNISKETKNPTTIDTDDNVEDFELSYSENSNDKLFKSVNNSESSIEMKLTDCGTTEEEAISRKLEEINGPKELVNGIEQSSVMEVA